MHFGKEQKLINFVQIYIKLIFFSSNKVWQTTGHKIQILFSSLVFTGMTDIAFFYTVFLGPYSSNFAFNVNKIIT